MPEPESRRTSEAQELSAEERRSLVRILRAVHEEADRPEQTPRLTVALRQLGVALRYVITGE